jgi:4'-phosphopantetheinyl transferase
MHGSCLGLVPHGLPGEVRVWWVDLDAYPDTAAPHGRVADARARNAHIAPDQDARRALAGRLALRDLVASALDRPPEDLTFESDPFGKPQVADGGGLHVNLSHSGRMGLIGISLDRPIGVDIEMVSQVVDADALARLHLTEREREEWLRAAGPVRDRAFLTCWTRKEACVKALGVGLSLPPASIDVGCAAGGRVVQIPVGASRCEVLVCTLQPPGEAVGAVAVASPEAVRTARQFFN